MIDKKSRRVVIINNLRSHAIDQAIFILKDTAFQKVATEKDLVSEAQSIIDRYISQVECLKETSCSSPKKSGFLRTLTTITLTAVFMLAVFFALVYNM